jgi:glycosyltransferase involved in cell wall biosynthesis
MKSLIWCINQTHRSSEGYGYTDASLWNYIGKSGLPITHDSDDVRKPSEIQDIQANIPGLDYSFSCSYLKKICINHTTPTSFSKSEIYSVGFTYWETNKLPAERVKICNEMDEIWTTSKYMQGVFIDSGIRKPVYNFKLGVDPSIYFPKKRTPHREFTFLSLGSPSTRKNSQTAVNAFLKLFGGNYEYKLIYKSHGPPDARIIRNGVMNPLNHPQIEVIDYEVSHEELAKLYDKADCLLYPTSGEGWGLIPFQSIAKGIPTICTNVLACTEFADMSIPLDFTWSTENIAGIYEYSGEWGKPVFDDLCDKMLYVVNNYEKVSDKTYKSAEFINQNMTWEKVSEDYIDRCWEILKIND